MQSFESGRKMPHLNKIAAMRLAIEAAGVRSYSIRLAVRRVLSARMRTSTYRATSQRSAASRLSDCESQGSRASSRFNFNKTRVS